MSGAPLGPDTAALAVRLLGGLQVRRDSELLPHPFPTRKTASLFAFLLLHPRAEFSRAFLAASFWPDVDEDAAHQSLRAALVPLRRFLEPRPERKGRCLLSHRDTLSFFPPPDCWVDVWAFEQAANEARDARAGSAAWLAALERAAALYAGDLLPDHGEEWCAIRREQLRQRLLACLHDLTRAEEHRHQYERACAWARRALTVDRCDEESHRNLMRLYHRLGEHARALQQYRECCRALREELDAAPDPETIALYQWLRPQPAREKWVPRWWETALLDPDLMGPLVGREQEQDRMRAAWERARAGRGELLLLTGEAGIGKSRLGRQMLQGVALAGGLALYGQASALESRSLYRPLIDPLRRALELAEEHGLTLCAPVWLGQVARLLPELRQEAENLGAVEGASPRLLEEGMAQLLLTLAGQRPVCLFLDDLHWADAATGRFLHYLAHQSRQARILLLGSYREGEVPESDWLGPWLTEVEGRRMAASFHLGRLSEAEVVRLLEQLAEGQATTTLLRPLGERLYEETEGNPLFLLVTLRELFDRGYLVVNEERRWQLAPLAAPGSRLQAPGSDEAGGPAEPLPGAWSLEPGAAPEGRLPLPVIVQRVVRQRVGRLRAEDRHLLACAAVIGRRFTFEALRRAAGREADGPLPMEATLAGVERLLAADLIRAQAHPAAFDFRHDKIREVVYEDLLPIRRQELHRRVGEALEVIYGAAEMVEVEESRFPNWFRRPPPPPARARIEEHAQELARHYHQAVGLIGPEKAARYYILAGTRARALSAYPEAVSDLLAVRSLLAELPPDTTRLALWGQIMEQLAPAYLGVGRGEAAEAVLQDYLDRCEQHVYGQGIVRGCTLLGQFFEMHRGAGGVEPILGLYERAIAACEAYGLEDEIVYPQSHLAFALVWLASDPERAEALARLCLTRAEKRPDPLLLQRLYSTLMWAATRQGNVEGFEEAFRASLDWGGPFEQPLKDMLETIEETYHHARPVPEDATFIDLCHRMAAGYARAGLEAPFQQWYLAPVAAPPPPGRPALQEDFDAAEWHASLVWQDPTGRSRLDRVTKPGWLGITPAAGGDLWPEANLNAPRLMTAVQNDIVAQTRLELGQPAAVFAGLLLWRNEQNFVRLELRDLPSGRMAVHVEACVAERFRFIGRGHCQRRTMWLRLQRAGEEVRCLCSANGTQWMSCGSLRLPPGETDQVGLHVIYRQPGTHAWFDSLEVWQATNTGAQ